MGEFKFTIKPSNCKYCTNHRLQKWESFHRRSKILDTLLWHLKNKKKARRAGIHIICVLFFVSFSFYLIAFPVHITSFTFQHIFNCFSLQFRYSVVQLNSLQIGFFFVLFSEVQLLILNLDFTFSIIHCSFFAISQSK